VPRRLQLASSLLALSLACLACDRGGGGGSPTAPPQPTGKRFQFTVGGVAFDGLLEATVTFDGREVARTDWSAQGGPCGILCGINADVQGISPGEHTVAFTVVRQPEPVGTYALSCHGIITDPTNSQQQVINTPQQQLRLRAGQSATFRIRF
jgi:hypothetical protein